MAISEAYQNSQSVTGTEHSLPNDATYSSSSPITTDGVYQLFLDLNALAAGDKFELKVYEAISSAGTQRLVYHCVFSDAQADPLWASPSLILMHKWDMTLKKLAGTDRTIDWSIRVIS